MKEFGNHTEFENGYALLYFSQQGCNPCKTMEKILLGFEKNHGDRISFLKIDVHQFPHRAKAFNIKSVPTTVLVKDGKIIDRFAGFLDDVDLDSKLMNLLYDLNSETGFDFESLT